MNNGNYERMTDTDTEVKQILHRCRTSDTLSVYNGEKRKNEHIDRFTRIRKSLSFDSNEKDKATKYLPYSTGPLQRRAVTTVRRRANKRKNKSEPEFRHDSETYEKIRERVLQERAVTNAIDILQERWKMIMLMYDDCIELNDEKMERKLRKLSVQRQYEMIVVASIFVLLCLLLLNVLIAVTSYLQYK